MMNFAQEMTARSLLSGSNAEIGERIRQTERMQGFVIVNHAPWLDWDDWSDRSIFSTHLRRVRLVAIEAKKPGNGAFTRLIERIEACRLIPTLVEPNQSLIDWCKRHDYRERHMGKGQFRQTVWYPR